MFGRRTVGGSGYTEGSSGSGPWLCKTSGNLWTGGSGSGPQWILHYMFLCKRRKTRDLICGYKQLPLADKSPFLKLSLTAEWMAENKSLQISYKPLMAYQSINPKIGHTRKHSLVIPIQRVMNVGHSYLWILNYKKIKFAVINVNDVMNSF